MLNLIGIFGLVWFLAIGLLLGRNFETDLPMSKSKNEKKLKTRKPKKTFFQEDLGFSSPNNIQIEVL